MRKEELKELVDRIVKAKNVIVDIHAIQSFPAHCMNRDDTGTPKTMIFGGTLRNRIASQCWMSAIRNDLPKYYEGLKLGIRTKQYPEEIAKEIVNLDSSISEKDALETARTLLIIAKVMPDPEKKKKASTKKAENLDETASEVAEESASVASVEDQDNESDKGTSNNEKKAVFFISRKQINAVAKIAVDYLKDEKIGSDGKKESKKVTINRYKPLVEKALEENPTIDMALCGRMAAGNPDLGYEASREIADAFTTHAAEVDFDFFSCVDDLNSNGAAHIDTQSFTSGTVYRYFNLDINNLLQLLTEEETVKGTAAVIESFIKSVPSGKIKTKAHECLPNLVYLTIRTDHHENLCNAFERAVKADDEGYIKKSKEALKNYAAEEYEAFNAPAIAWIVRDDWGDMARKVSCDQLVEEVSEVLDAYLKARRN